VFLQGGFEVFFREPERSVLTRKNTMHEGCSYKGGYNKCSYVGVPGNVHTREEEMCVLTREDAGIVLMR